MAQWRRFAFFEKEVLKDESTGKSWLKDVDVNCASGNRGILAFGDKEGSVHLVNRQLGIRKFEAHQHFVSYVVMLRDKNFLVTLGDGIDPQDGKLGKKARKKEKENDSTHREASPDTTATIKVWGMDQFDREGQPKLVQEIKIFAKYPEEAVMAFAVYKDLSQIAVGLKNGAIILFRSENKKSKDPLPPLLLQPATQFPVTALSFSEWGEGKDSKTFLYAGTKRGLTSYECHTKDVPPGKNQNHRGRVLDERGVHPHCAVVNENGEIVVGQSDAVYFFNPEDRGASYSIEGEKRCLHFFKDYLLVAHVDPRGRHQINVYDLKNKFIAFNCTLTLGHGRSASRGAGDDIEEVRHIVSEFGSVMILSSMGLVYKLTEKDTASKLDILFRKKLFPIAISLAFSSNLDHNNVMDIFRRYADTLYEKRDFDNAIRQYTRTIGHLEPSYVIRRFLDAQRIGNLATYLEVLHEKAVANSDHTTLLLNCYTKLKDVKKLDRFVNNEVYSGDSLKVNTSDPNGLQDGSAESSAVINAGRLNFDVETAISVLRTNYREQALSLAKKHQEHSWYLKIQLEHISYVDQNEALNPAHQARVLDSLEYIKKLPFDEAEANLKKYGRTLVTHLPNETTSVLKLLCSGTFESSSITSSREAAKKSDPIDFIHLYVAHPKHLRSFLDYIVKAQPESSPVIGNTLLELLLQEHAEKVLEEMDEEGITRLQNEVEEKVMTFLDNPRIKYGDEHALTLVQMHGVKKGQRYLYNKLHMYRMLVQHHMENLDDQSVIDEVKRHGEKDLNLWLQALKYFTQRGEDDKTQWNNLTTILSLIDKYPMISSMQVVQILSQSKTLPLSVVKTFLSQRLKMDEDKMKKDLLEIGKYKKDTEKIEKEILELKTKAVVFQTKTCDLCNHELDPPAVHFLCQHSFHASCLSDVEKECLICAPDFKHVLGLQASLALKASNHEIFYNQLESSTDGFNTIAEYFGKGIFKVENPTEGNDDLDERNSNDF